QRPRAIGPHSEVEQVAVHPVALDDTDERDPVGRIDARVGEAREARTGWEARRRVSFGDCSEVAAERDELERAAAVRPEGRGAGRVDVVAPDAGLKERGSAVPEHDRSRVLERVDAVATEAHTRGQSGRLFSFSDEQREPSGALQPEAFVVEVVDPGTG